MIFWLLFIAFAKIGLFSIGGGYAALPLIKAEIVGAQSWLSVGEFTDVLTISQMTPGPIAINAATFTGMKIAGFGGAVCATLGCIFPSLVIVLTVARIYVKYRELSAFRGVLGSLRPAVVGLIASAGVSVAVSAFFLDGIVALSGIDIASVLIFAASFILLRTKKVNPIWVMTGAGALGGVIFSLIKI